MRIFFAQPPEEIGRSRLLLEPFLLFFPSRCAFPCYRQKRGELFLVVFQFPDPPVRPPLSLIPSFKVMKDGPDSFAGQLV